MKNTKKLLDVSYGSLLTSDTIKILDAEKEKIQITIGTLFKKVYIFDFINKKIEYKKKEYSFENQLFFDEDSDYKYIILNNKKYKLFFTSKKCVTIVNDMCYILQELAKGNFGEEEVKVDFNFEKPILYLHSQLDYINAIVLNSEENTFIFDVGILHKVNMEFNLNNRTIKFKGTDYNFDDVDSIEVEVDKGFEIYIVFKIKGLRKPIKYTLYLEKDKEEEYTAYAQKLCKAFNQVINNDNVKVDNDKDIEVYIDETLTDDRRQILSFIMPLTESSITNLNYITNVDMRKIFAKSIISLVGINPNKIEKNRVISDIYFNTEELDYSVEYKLFTILMHMRIEKSLFITQNNSDNIFWENMKVYTKYIKDNNSSYKEFSEKFLKGREEYLKKMYEKGEVDKNYMEVTFKKEQEEKVEFINNMLSNNNSVWNKVKF